MHFGAPGACTAHVKKPAYLLRVISHYFSDRSLENSTGCLIASDSFLTLLFVSILVSLGQNGRNHGNLRLSTRFSGLWTVFRLVLALLLFLEMRNGLLTCCRLYFIALAGAATAFAQNTSQSSTQNTSTKATETSTLSKKSSGSISYPESEISTDGTQSSSSRKRSVTLAEPPRAGDVPTLAADLNTAMMGPDMVKAMDEQYAERLRNFSIHNGYYASSKFSTRPNPTGKGIQEEVQIRKDMAKSIQRYMFVRGIPKFLATKPETKRIAQTYNQVIVMTKIEGRTESRWEYKTGINPFQLRAFGNVAKDGWFFESSTFYDKEGKYYLKDIYLKANKSYQSGNYSTGCNYEVFTEVLTPNVGKRFSKALNGTLALTLPLASTYVMPNAVTTASLNYSF